MEIDLGVGGVEHNIRRFLDGVRRPGGHNFHCTVSVSLSPLQQGERENIPLIEFGSPLLMYDISLVVMAFCSAS